jgi:hypothetical protein
MSSSVSTIFTDMNYEEHVEVNFWQERKNFKQKNVIRNKLFLSLGNFMAT